ELIKGEKGHQTKPSITLDMYEPHWSAANRYLEISGNDRPGGASFNGNKSNVSDYDEAVASPMLTTATDSNPSTAHYPHQNLNNNNNNNNRSNPNQPDQNNTHFKESSAPLLLNTALPLSPISPTSTLGHANSLVGPLSPVVVDISTPTDVWPRTADPTEATTGRQDKGAIGNKAVATAGGGGGGVSNGVDIQQQSGSTGAKSLNSGSTPRRALSAVAAGVTREDLQRSAERIYCKYLTPQAEKPVRVPGSVRHRVAFVMDILMTSGSGVVAANGNGVGDTATATGGGGARGVGLQGLRSPSMVSLKRKSNAGTTKSSLSLSANEKAVNGSGRRPSATDSHRPKTNQTSGSGSSVSQPDHELGLVFAEAREIVFEGMETFYFPRFLKARAYGNMVHSHRVLRAVIGLFLLFLGFVAVLCLIFLNVRSRSVRAWTKLFQYAKIKEPYIMKLHRQRAAKVAAVAVVYTICVATIFGVIPGHRL
ncbi:Bud site selection protein, Revert to axial protein 1, partial [Lunasporangiospora selenospora]